MKKIWIISDSHFNHPAILDFENRPINYQEQIIRKINTQLKDGDILIHLGDVIFDKPSQLSDILLGIKPNITKVLVRGNHDKSGMNFYLNKGFDLVIDSFRMYYGNKNIIFSHKPMEKLEEGYINIHGHLHSRENTLDKNKYFCYSAELENYMPLLLDNILRKWK